MPRVAKPFSAYIWYGPTCWEWMSGKTRFGYGVYRNPDTKKTVMAHRYAYETHYGKIPPGMQVCHRCDNRACVRHGHFFLGTNSDNQVDSVEKKRHVNSKKTICIRGHALVGENLYIKPSTGARRCRECSNQEQRTRRAANKPVPNVV